MAQGKGVYSALTAIDFASVLAAAITFDELPLLQLLAEVSSLMPSLTASQPHQPPAPLPSPPSACGTLV